MNCFSRPFFAILFFKDCRTRKGMLKLLTVMRPWPAPERPMKNSDRGRLFSKLPAIKGGMWQRNCPCCKSKKTTHCSKKRLRTPLEGDLLFWISFLFSFLKFIFHINNFLDTIYRDTIVRWFYFFSFFHIEFFYC